MAQASAVGNLTDRAIEEHLSNRPPLILTKLDAAVRQTRAAMAAFEAGDFDIAVTLACAAEGMIPSGQRGSVHDLTMKAAKTLLGSKEATKFNSKINERRDWLKHKTVEMPNEICIDAVDAALAILRAMTKFEKIDQDRADSNANFMIWAQKHLLPETNSVEPQRFIEE